MRSSRSVWRTVRLDYSSTYRCCASYIYMCMCDMAGILLFCPICLTFSQPRKQSEGETSPIPTKGPVEGTHHPPPNTQATYCLPEAGAASLGTPTHIQPRKSQCTAPPEALTHKGEKFSPARLGTNHHATALLS